jgi:hypothetical protein
VPVSINITEAPELDIEAADFSCAGPAEVPAGTTKLTATNVGQSLHQVALMKLAEGKTLADVTEYLKSSGESAGFPDWMQPSGGPAAAVPGAQASTFVELQPGANGMMCAIPDAEGVPHFAQGQLSPLTVTEATSAMAPPPAPGVAVQEEDFAFGVPSEVSAGAAVIQATNGGGQPPALPLGGAAPHMMGASQSFPVDLAPGRYALPCFLTDPATGKAHAELGMMAEFEAK